jgi:hypothetical protein
LTKEVNQRRWKRVRKRGRKERREGGWKVFLGLGKFPSFIRPKAVAPG